MLVLLINSVFCFAEDPEFVKEQSYLLKGFMDVKDKLSHQGTYVDGVYLNKKIISYIMEKKLMNLICWLIILKIIKREN